jgi:HAD superfamily hydrolase (TIGR01548 family)
MNLKSKKILIFDVDDTLIDTSKSYDLVIKSTVKHFTNQEPNNEDLNLIRKEGIKYGVNNDWNVTWVLIQLIKNHSKEGWSQILRQEKLDKPQPDSSFYREIKEKFQQMYLGNPAFGGQGLIDTGETPMWQTDFFEELTKRGYQLAVVTSRPEKEAGHTLYRVNNLQRFLPEEFMISAGSLDFKGQLIPEKPSPEPIIEILRRTKKKENEAVYIGNSNSDYLASKSAEIDFIQVGTSQITRIEEPENFDYLKLNSVNDLLTIIN